MTRPWACLGLIAALLMPATTADAQTSQLAAAVKATYLYKLAPFVEWPPGNPARPFTICIVGPDPFGPVLDQAIAGQTYSGRPFAVARMATLNAGACDIVYAGGAPQQVAATLHAAEGHPVLTVTDGSRTPGMVDFMLHNGKVRFRIDQAAAETHGLTISSKLLSLALSVRTAKGRS